MGAAAGEGTAHQSEMEARPKQKVEPSGERTRPAACFQPAVDISESPEELVVVADMPGVGQDGVEIEVEGNQLTLEGHVRPKDYEGLKPLHVEYAIGDYYRRFTLGDAIDRDAIKGEMRDGVLTLHLPKAKQARVRRIPVS
jgi:HSP20 family molecular chaperone IbpA